MRKLIVALAVLILGATVPAKAQYPVTMVWEMDNAVADAQSFTYWVYLDALAKFPATPVTCALVNNITTCQSPLYGLTQGDHTIQLSAESLIGGEGGKSLPYVFRYPLHPPTPQNLRIVR